MDANPGDNERESEDVLDELVDDKGDRTPNPGSRSFGKSMNSRWLADAQLELWPFSSPALSSPFRAVSPSSTPFRNS